MVWLTAAVRYGARFSFAGHRSVRKVVLISPSSQRPSLDKEASRNNRPAYLVPSYRRALLETSLDSARYRSKVSRHRVRRGERS